MLIDLFSNMKHIIYQDSKNSLIIHEEISLPCHFIYDDTGYLVIKINPVQGLDKINYSCADLKSSPALIVGFEMLLQSLSVF